MDGDSYAAQPRFPGGSDSGNCVFDGEGILGPNVETLASQAIDGGIGLPFRDVASGNDGLKVMG